MSPHSCYKKKPQAVRQRFVQKKWMLRTSLWMSYPRARHRPSLHRRVALEKLPLQQRTLLRSRCGVKRSGWKKSRPGAKSEDARCTKSDARSRPDTCAPIGQSVKRDQIDASGALNCRLHFRDSTKPLPVFIQPPVTLFIFFYHVD